MISEEVYTYRNREYILIIKCSNINMVISLKFASNITFEYWIRA